MFIQISNTAAFIILPLISLIALRLIPKKDILKLKKNILIVGASQGIGKQLAIQLKHHNLILVARTLADLQELQAIIPGSKVLDCDYTDKIEMKKLHDFVQREFDNLDGVFLCVGVLSTLLFGELVEHDEFDKVVDDIFRINALAPIRFMKQFMELLVKSKAFVCVLGSSAGVMAAPTRTLYCATKHAVTGFFRSLKLEMNGVISIHLVLPGSVDTLLRANALDSHLSTQTKNSRGISPEICAKIILDGVNEGLDEIYIPGYYRFAASLIYLFPSLVNYLARRKYGV